MIREVEREKMQVSTAEAEGTSTSWDGELFHSSLDHARDFVLQISCRRGYCAQPLFVDPITSNGLTEAWIVSALISVVCSGSGTNS